MSSDPEQQSSSSSSNYMNLIKLNQLKDALIESNHFERKINIDTNDVFRIVRMAYKDDYLIIFLSGYLKSCPNQLFQFYVQAKCPLYSYKFCYNNHIFENCRNNCSSLKTFVMPGLRNVYMQKYNVMKYKRESEATMISSNKGNKNVKPLDYFLKDINRVHMQTDLKEGQYVRFNEKQVCVDRQLKCYARDLSTIKDMFTIVLVEELKKEIVPVILCYDIETHSRGQKFSNALEDHVISISMVMRRNDKMIKTCLYYMKEGADDDLHDETNDDATVLGDIKYDNNVVNIVRFEDELDMLKAFFELLPVFNPDCILDYNGDKFDLPYMMDRIKTLCALRKNAPNREMAKRFKYSASGCNFDASKITKIVRYDLDPVDIETQVIHDKFTNKINNHLFGYYVHVDLYQFLSTDPEHSNLENYQLNTVAEHYLKMSKVDLNVSEMLRLYNDNCIKKIIEYNIQDSVLPIMLFLRLEIIDFLYTQCMLLYMCTDDLLCNISHKISVVFFHLCLTNTVTNKEGEEKPDPFIFNKNDLNVTSGRQNVRYNSFNNNSDNSGHDKNMVDLTLLNRKPIPAANIPKDAVKLCTTRPVCNYKGGKVLSPKSGFEKWVVTLDFNSLYPTIMMYGGICFSNLFIADDGFVYLDKNKNAINPKLLINLLDLRKKFKDRRDRYEIGTFQYNINDKMQNAVKRIANSIYGYFGIYFKVLANHITKIGRTKLVEAIKMIESMSESDEIKTQFGLSSVKFKVIYGDTDSCFIRVAFVENEITEHNRYETIKNMINDFVLKRLNDSWHGQGFKMSLENVMPSLILLKKKKYCYLNTENRIKYKGWLIKKDMPLFMRKTFRSVIDSFLRNHSVACGMELLLKLMSQYYDDFGKESTVLADYSFSMSYNEKSTSLKKRKSADGQRKPVITIAKHCREILFQSGSKNLPGNGDRIPFLLVDVKGKITEKSYPLALFDKNDSSLRVSWIKHVNILCNFMNELLEIFGNRPEFEYYFDKICSLYMSKQIYDVKYPVLVECKKSIKKKNEDDDDDVSCDDNDDDFDNMSEDEVINLQENNKLNTTRYQFRMYVKRPKKQLNHTKVVCRQCLQV
ncbi:DNA polymerase [Hemileuca sp. nucleopolyhedrovirus]|uniref:DNA polymerase n=1 Tax=Hemileuca sp. nucleopolyhedrovirus TaxID=1367203 RepID=S5MQ70_9ABAC|nr:DNA polymerase [Hemileuca sp. nucleopolyhedrovirus]AGR56818.1 DNA polymerase [Hemileuca sp. nucleopolyhedrovirus]